MAKSKETTVTTTKKDTKTKGVSDPVATRNLIRLLNLLALLLAITAFLLQLFAVLTHHWKWQRTDLRPLFAANDRNAETNFFEDGRIEQNYGLYSRDVNVYGNNDEQLDVHTSTRFPRLDNGDEDLHACLSQTSTLRGALLTCSDRITYPQQCHCRRYPHWNAIIFFEVAALILLGIVVFIAALLSTHFHALLKPIGVALAFLAFLFLLIGLILILSYLKRETHTIADTYPHIYPRLANQVDRRYHHGAIRTRRQAHETYRAYPLQPGQHAYNATHYQQYSREQNSWIYLPYTSGKNVQHAGRTQQSSGQRQSNDPNLRVAYGPQTEYDRVFEHTRAGIGYSTVLSILSMIPALLVPLLLAYSWLTAKKLPAEVKTVTTTVRTEYVPAPQEVSVETVPLTRGVPTETVRQGQYDNYSGRPEQVVLRDVVIRDEHPTATTHTYRT